MTASLYPNEDPTQYVISIITANTEIGKCYDSTGQKLPTSGGISGGTVEVYIGTLQDIAQDINELSAHQALTCGVPIGGESDHLLTTKAHVTPGQRSRKGLPVIARAKEYFEWPDEPGFLLFDYDPDHYASRAVFTSIAEVVEGISEALGVRLGDFDYIAKPSGSSYVSTPDGVVSGFRGCHILLAVDSLKVMGEGHKNTIIDIAAERGFAVCVVSAAGSALRRTMFDNALHVSPCNVLFAGATVCEPPTTSSRPVAVNETGRQVDLRALVENCDRTKAETEWRKVIAEKKPAMATQVEVWKERQRDRGMTEQNITIAAQGKELPASWAVYMDDETQTTLLDLIQEEYEGYFRDPVEPEYGPGKARLIRTGNRWSVQSFAHGGSTFPIRYDFDALEKALEGLENPLIEGRELMRQAIDVAPTQGAHMLRAAAQAAQVPNVPAQGAVVAQVRQAISAGMRERMDDDGSINSLYAYIDDGKVLNLRALREDNAVRLTGLAAFNTAHAEYKADGKSALENLLEMGGMTRYDSLAFVPPEKHGDAIPDLGARFNGWRPGPPIEPSARAPELWLRLAENMIEDDDARENAYDWLAFHLQYPGIKCNWQMLWYSHQEGVGKDTLLLPLHYAMGRHNVSEVSTQELLGDFSAYLIGCPQLLVLQELDAAHKAQTKNVLKPLAASTAGDMHSVNTKGNAPIEVANTQGVIALTNMAQPFSLDKGDRRWYMIKCNDKLLGSAFFRELYAYYYSGGMREVAAWLLARDLTDFNKDVIPAATKYKLEVLESSKTGYAMAVEDWVGLNPHVRIVSTKALVNHLKAHSDIPLNSKQITNALRDLGWVSAVGKRTPHTMRGMMTPQLAAENPTPAELFRLMDKSLAVESAKMADNLINN